MTSDQSKIIVEWAAAHEPADGPGHIAQHLGAGLDEGPLLVIPALGSRGLRRAEGKIFEDVMSYQAHLDHHRDDVRADQTRVASAPRWTALVRRSGTDDKSHGLAAIYALKMLLAPSTKKLFHPKRAKLRSEQDYLVLPGPYHSDVELRIENIGEGLRDARDAFPVLARSMECSPDGLLTPLPDEEDWDADDVWN